MAGRVENLKPFPKGVSGNPGGRPNDVKNPAVLLAWAAPNSDTWDAIDLTLARKLHFQENLQQSQELLKQALSKNPKILGTVADQGVSFGTEKGSPTVIAFDRAVKNFKILPLPSVGLPAPPPWPSR